MQLGSNEKTGEIGQTNYRRLRRHSAGNGIFCKERYQLGQFRYAVPLFQAGARQELGCDLMVVGQDSCCNADSFDPPYIIEIKGKGLEEGENLSATFENKLSTKFLYKKSS